MEEDKVLGGLMGVCVGDHSEYLTSLCPGTR